MTDPFLDTNVLVYAYSQDPVRSSIAAVLVTSGGIVSVQVLNEFVDVARRKLRFSWAEIDVAIADLLSLLGPPIPTTMEIQRAALAISARFGFRIYDSLIIGAARQAGCSVVLSEDLRNGQTVEGVTIVNPFAPASGQAG